MLIWSPMRYVVLIAAAAAFASAATEWTEVNSPNFHLITTAGTAEGRHTIEYFEQVRDFFMRNRSQITTRLPVTIVLFRSMKEFKPYSPNEVANAFYTGDQSRDFIVMSGSSEDERPIAVHEYMHLLVRNLDLKLPLWLNEGLADVYSSLTPYDGKIAVGMVPKGRAYSLAIDKWIPLNRILAVQHDSPEYNEKARAGAFYAQSWMLVHMLMLSDYYRGNFGKFVATVSAGSTSETAFLQIYNRSVADVSKDLNVYYRSNLLKAALFDTKLQKFEGFQTRTADDFTVELLLARVSGLTGRKDEAKRRLEHLAAEYPNRWEAHEALGNIAWRNRDLEGARNSLRRAVDLNPPLWSVYWDYARVAQGQPAERDKVITALQKTLQLNGANPDAKFALAYELFEAGRYEESLTAYKAMRSVPQDRAATLFLGLAHSALRLGKFDEAKTAAANASKYAKEPRDLQSVAQLMDYFDRRDKAEAQRIDLDAVHKGQPVSAPAPENKQMVAAAIPAGPSEILSSVKGVLKHVDCLSAQARLRVESEGKTISLLITDANAVTIRNQPGTSVNLSCGPQPAQTRVFIEYVDRVDAQTQTTGYIRTVEFYQ